MASSPGERRQPDRDTSPPGAAAEAAAATKEEDRGRKAAPAAPAKAREHHTEQSRQSALALALAALGVVYGDIGTSPIYAFRQAFHVVSPTSANVLGVLSLITWALVLVVSVKYLLFVMRADNSGEGGIVALLALLLPGLDKQSKRVRLLWILAGLFGAALLYGDGAITPAISVLSAVEGLRLVSHSFDRFVVPLTLAILIGLFAVQRWGSQRVGSIFGPAMFVWFVVLGVLGAHSIVENPGILVALSPLYAGRFLVEHGWTSAGILGAVVLVVTGAEALYADMGHFGRGPIRAGWFFVVLPTLLLNYLGQGALVLRDGRASQPFFQLAPGWFTLPLVILSTVTTVIASQALISGAFSLTRQLMHLGYSPLLTVLHTSAEQEGQVYVPAVNWLLLAACVLLVANFHTSARLANAYGLAVSGTMALTTLLYYRLIRHEWHWSRLVAVPLVAGFLCVDLAFLVSNVEKIPTGGWLPLTGAIVITFVFVTWRRGRARLLDARRRMSEAVGDMIDQVEKEKIIRTPGMGIFVSAAEDVAPASLRQCVDRVRSLHEQILLITVKASTKARVSESEWLQIETLPAGFVRVVATYGFIQSVSLDAILHACEVRGVQRSNESPTYYLTREHLSPTGTSKMAHWRKVLFIFLHRNAPTMQDFFSLPRQQVLELGLPVEI